MNIGFIFAAITILLFGSWAVPTKTLKIDSRALAFWLTVGHLFISGIIFIFAFQSFSIEDSIGPFIAGILWAVGITLGFIGIKNLGITRAIGIWIPVIIVTSALLGLIFFKEIAALSNGQLMLTIFGLLLLIASGLAVVLSSKGESKLGNFKLGVLAAIGIGVLHGAFFIPLRTSDLPISISFLPLSLGMVITMSLIVVSQKVKIAYNLKTTLRMAVGGLILGGGNLLAQLTMDRLGVSVGYPLTQLSIIVNALWGTLFFKEVNTKRGKVLIALSIIIALVGAVVVNLARTN